MYLLKSICGKGFRSLLSSLLLLTKGNFLLSPKPTDKLHKLSLCNVYAPNDQVNQLQFMQELNNCLLDKSELTSLIIGGDWNCTLSKKDKIGGAPWKLSSYRNLILTTMEMFDLVDIQRMRHPKLRKFTYESKSLKLKSRIDFFLIAKNLSGDVKNSEIYHAIAPDHDAIYISFSRSNKSPRGPGLWKFNNTLLNDIQYVSTVRDTYAQACSYYSHVSDKRLFWELMKMEIRSVTISFSKCKAKRISNREQELRRRIDQLDVIICENFSSPYIDGVLREYDGLKTELKSIYEEKGKQTMFRAKCRWIENGERPTKYFFNLEKSNYNKKTISELRLHDDSTTRNETVILEQIENYYRNLYTSDLTFSETAYDTFIDNVDSPKLSEDVQETLEGPLTYEECKKILETFQNDKAPGEDGFTVEFYTYFFELLGNDLIASFNEAYEQGEFSISQRRGIITLIPKEDGSLLDLSNWRPITLLNVDFKIASKAIAKRIEPTLPNLIHSDQTGFVKGRYIGENIRLTNDIMEYTSLQNLPGILTSLDFRKAFDSIEWPFIMKTLDHFNFGSDIKRWIKLFYTNTETAVQNNGFITSWFKPSKGVRQGCPLSPYLFILSAEVLSKRIRQDSNVRGIKVFGKEIKLSQFADDTTLFNADIESLEMALKIVGDFGKIAGLSLNVKKTKALWLGKWKSNKNKPLDLKWFHSPVKILGIYFSYNIKENNELTFYKKIEKLQTKLDMWSSRDLTIFGRAMLIKTLGISQLIYSASNLDAPEGIVEVVRTKSFKFLWKNKKDKIKRSGLYQDSDNGGIRMTDFAIMLKALKLAWIPRLLRTSDNSNWCIIPKHYFRSMGGLNFLLRCNYDTKFFNDLPLFYKKILDFFNELKTLYLYDQKQELILFNNKDILVDGKPIFFSEWFNKGILSINDLLNESGNVLTFYEFRDKYSCKSNFLQYYQVVSAIPKRLWSLAKGSDTINKSFFTRNDNIFSLNESTQINLYKGKTKDFYNLLNAKIHTEDQTGPKRWSEKLSLKKDVRTKIFKSLKNICKETKLKEFQFKLIHRTIVTKKELFRFGIKADDECLYCGDKDSIEHSFIECMFTKLFSQKVLNWFNQANGCQISPTTEETLFGITTSSHDTTLIRKFNYTTLFMRHYIYSTKLNSLAISIQDFISKLLIKYSLENLS